MVKGEERERGSRASGGGGLALVLEAKTDVGAEPDSGSTRPGLTGSTSGVRPATSGVTRSGASTKSPNSAEVAEVDVDEGMRLRGSDGDTEISVVVVIMISDVEEDVMRSKGGDCVSGGGERRSRSGEGSRSGGVSAFLRLSISSSVSPPTTSKPSCVSAYGIVPDSETSSGAEGARG